MRSVLAAVLVAVLAGVVAATVPQHILAVRDVSEVQARKLAAKFDVRGVFDDLTLVVGTEDDLAMLRAFHPFALDIGAYTPDNTVVVLEKEPVQTDTARTREEWLVNTQREIALESNLVVLLTLKRQIVVMAMQGDITAFRNLQLSGDTEILPMLGERIKSAREGTVERIKRTHNTFRTAHRKADIPELLAQVNQTVLRDFIEYLSGEDGVSPILSRNSYAVGSGVTQAADWLQDQYESYGFSVAQESFRADMGPNVIATILGVLEPTTYVIVGAHFDSRSTSSTSPTQRAPGANDDGSGTGALLQIAKIVHDNGLRFRYSIILGSWCGEEQGLIGSRAYAQKARAGDMDILAMLQADMIAYRVSSEAAQCAFPDRNDDKELTALAMDVVNTYVPAVRTCLTTACCSDHQSFTEQGYSATQLFERCGSIADNQYHQSGDLVNRAGFDLDQVACGLSGPLKLIFDPLAMQLALNTQALLANLLVLAQSL